MKKAIVWYEQVAGAKINFEKSKGLWLGAWRGGAGVTPSESSSCGSGPVSN